ncbi:capsule biosynthesis GfcC family protein [Vibrio pelagius]|uniref:Capsule biosynthesis GfcC family protein n=1 Tax=Vibrio pelagius TaxID=28169 RepID=A0ABY5G6L5_VIBPE|nr:capsule biosynthesis GfcC family protein [Vibrio pelagius]UTT85789.1 capsule biosynthesis GfcC family protein [Vibrio pelagius]
MKSVMKLGKRTALASLGAALFLSNMAHAQSLESHAQQAQQPQLSVELPVQGVTLNYTQPVRLEQVLNDANANGALGYFPLSAQLFDRNAQQQVDTLKEQVLEQLNQLALQEPQARSVITQLESFDYQARYFVDLDRNAVISQPEKNPLLVSKDMSLLKNGSLSKEEALESASLHVSEQPNQAQRFDLYLTSRAIDVTVVGAVKQTHKLTLIEHGQLDNYLSKLPKGELLEIADKSTAFVIQPDGHVDEISYAYWNTEQAYFAPGAILFIAFDSLPSEFSTLNQNIIELLRHKVNL